MQLEPAPESTMDPIITVYSAPDCQGCNNVKRWLDKYGHPYTEVDLSTDLDALRAVKALGYQRAPVTIINTHDGDHIVPGFNPIELGLLLGKEKAA